METDIQKSEHRQGCLRKTTERSKVSGTDTPGRSLVLDEECVARVQQTGYFGVNGSTDEHEGNGGAKVWYAAPILSTLSPLFVMQG